MPCLALTLLLAFMQGPGEAAAGDRAVPGIIEASTARDGSFLVDAALALQPDALRAAVSATERGLAWLAQRQSQGGAFVAIVGHKMENDYVELETALSIAEQRAAGRGHLGVSALCGMAFLAAGHLPDRGHHGNVVQRTLDYVLAHGHENGFLSDSGTRMYSHAFATLFLAEAYGMAGGAACKLALERAVNLIVDSQNQHGGWRYNPFDREVDLSVTVCQLQALRAARNIGIKVPDDTVARAIAYVRQSQVRGPQRPRQGRRGSSAASGGGQFYYKITGRGAYQKADEFAINAAALTALASAGVYDKELHEPTLDFLERAYRTTADYYGSHYFYWYGNYYACQAFFQTGGARFDRFYERLCRDLLETQRKDGSWSNDVGPGDEFATAVACLLLSLPQQYLPIFQR